MDISNELVKKVIEQGIQENKMINGKNIRFALEERKLQLIEEINNVLKELDEFNLFYFSNTLDEKQNYCEVSLNENGDVYFNFHD